MNEPALPLELIYQIMDYFLPENPNALLPASDIRTRTLLSFTRVCRVTYPLATTYLMRHCVYLDSRTRLARFVNSLERSAETPTGRDRFNNVTAMYLAMFSGGDDTTMVMQARQTRALLCGLHGTLKRLVVDIEMLGREPRRDPRKIRVPLREGFAMLTELEELVFLGIDLDLSIFRPCAKEPVMWTMWPKIRRASLAFPHTAPGFWRDVALMPMLDSLVLSQPLGFDDNCKTEFFQHADRPIKVVLVNVSAEQPDMVQRRNWKLVDPEGKMRVLVYDVPTSFYGDESPGDLCRDWIKRSALDGTLWGWSGTLLE